MLISDVLKQARQSATKTASAPAAEAAAPSMKVAMEAGAADADRLLKVASTLGDAVAEQFINQVKSAFGYDPTAEAVKTASIQDLMYDTMYKIAEDVAMNVNSGLPASAVASKEQAHQDQVADMTVHYATMAARASNDAINSLQQGDEHTAIMQFTTAADMIGKAKSLAAQCEHQEVHAHVEQAAAVVAQASEHAHAMAGAGDEADEE